MKSNNPRIVARRRRLASSCSLALLGAVALVAIPGCDKNAGGGGNAGTAGKTGAGGGGSGGGFAVVDLDKSFRQVGWTDAINKDLSSYKNDVQLKLDSFGRDITKALEDERQSLGRAAKLSTAQLEEMRTNRDLDKLPLSKEQRDEWLRAQGNANQIAQGAQQDANTVLQQRRQQIMSSYAESVKPILRRVATANGYTAVMTPPNLFWYDTSVDITDKFTDELQKEKPTHTLPEPPAFNLPKINSINAPPTPPTTGPAAPR